MPRLIQPLIQSLHRLTNRKASATIILFLGAMLAMLRSNSPRASQYFSFLNAEIFVKIGGASLFSLGNEPLTIGVLINEGLMTVFFFLVGLEIKQEILVGSLSSRKKAFLPVIAALWGMLIPVLCFLLVIPSGSASAGATIPMATDIAFSLAVLSLLGSRVAPSLRTFLLALAVADDLGGIIVIAIFYAGTIARIPLALSGVLLLGLGIYNHLSKEKYLWITAVVGVLVWGLFMQSGIHPTIAGVLLAFTISALPKYQLSFFLKKIRRLTFKIIPKPLQTTPKAEILTAEQLAHLNTMGTMTNDAISPLQQIEHELTPLVEYLILPLFAFANMGIVFNMISAPEFWGVPFAVVFGLVIGKPLGIFLFSSIAERCSLVDFPEEMNRKNLFWIALFGGIGFTVSLFIAGLAYGETNADFLNQAKIGILLGSLIAGLVAYQGGKWLFSTKK